MRPPGRWSWRCCRTSPTAAAPYAVVENVVVGERWRGRGIGEGLMREAMERGREAGAYKLSLTTNLKRERAHEFYRKLGFVETHLGFEVTL